MKYPWSLGPGRITQTNQTIGSHGNDIDQPRPQPHPTHIQPHPTTTNNHNHNPHDHHTLRHAQHPIATTDDPQRRAGEGPSASEASDDDENRVEREEKQGDE